MARFWAAVLGSNVDEDSTAKRAYVEAPGWGGPNMWFVHVPEPKTAKNRRLGASVCLGVPGELLRGAAEGDDKLVRGEYLGWLHGLPFAVKDLAAAEGLLWTEGSPIYARRVADVDDLFVRRVRDAGAI